MLLIQCYAPLVVYGTEVRSVETEGAVGFTGVYEMPGGPVPAQKLKSNQTSRKKSLNNRQRRECQSQKIAKNRCTTNE